MPEKVIRQTLLQIAQERDEDKTFCPSEVARSLSSDEDSWRKLMPKVRKCAAAEEARGVLMATQCGKWIAIEKSKGAIRLKLRRDSRPPSTPCFDLLNLGPVVARDLELVGVQTLQDLRDATAIRAFEQVMVDRLHRGYQKGLFHAMYLYALFGAIHNENCMKFPQSIREFLKAEASQIRDDVMGKN
ncbi:MAG: DUF3253 domain-containing protein [Planctomycetota bacterium]